MDRLSNLPDAIRSRIVSLLHTRDAVKTSILSSRWRYICSSLSRLQLGILHERVNSKFVEDFKNIVNKMLMSHDESDIESFSIVVDIDDIHITSLNLNTWISLVIQHNARDIHLWVESQKPEKLPCCFYTCSTLRELALYHIQLIVPSIIEFPMLKDVTLYEVMFDGDYNTINRLISNHTTPVLEDLMIFYCDQIHTLSIFVPSLKSLKLYTNNHCHPKFNLSIPSLEKIDYSGEPLDVCSETLSSLVNATFQFSLCHGTNGFASKVLNGLQKVDVLTLKFVFIEFLSSDRHFWVSTPTLSCSLRHLNLQILHTKNHVHLTGFLTRSFPKLQTLHISLERCPQLGREEQWQTKQLPEGDKLRHLKFVEIKSFSGTDCQIDLVRYLLGCSSILEELNIIYLKQIDVYTRFMIAQKLLSFPRISTNVALFG